MDHFPCQEMFQILVLNGNDDHQDFLAMRRKQMATKIKEYYFSLRTEIVISTSLVQVTNQEK